MCAAQIAELQIRDTKVVKNLHHHSNTHAFTQRNGTLQDLEKVHKNTRYVCIRSSRGL